MKTQEEKKGQLIKVNLLIPKRPGNKYDAELPDSFEFRFEHILHPREKYDHGCQEYSERFGRVPIFEYVTPVEYLITLITYSMIEFGKTPEQAVRCQAPMFSYYNTTLYAASFGAVSATPLTWDELIREVAWETISKQRARSLFSKLRDAFESAMTEEGEETPEPSTH